MCKEIGTVQTGATIVMIQNYKDKNWKGEEVLYDVISVNWPLDGCSTIFWKDATCVNAVKDMVDTPVKITTVEELKDYLTNDGGMGGV